MSKDRFRDSGTQGLGRGHSIEIPVVPEQEILQRQDDNYITREEFRALSKETEDLKNFVYEFYLRNADLTDAIIDKMGGVVLSDHADN